MTETAEEFIARKNEQWQHDLERRKTIPMKDVGRQGRHLWVREAWTLVAQSNLPEKVFVIERLKYERAEGDRSYPGGAIPGAIEYRFGYYVIGQNGRARGHWMWGQYSPLIPAGDLSTLLSLARDEGTILPDQPVTPASPASA